MPKLYQPRLTQRIFAVECKEDVMIPKGHVMVITEDDTVIDFTVEQFKLIAGNEVIEHPRITDLDATEKAFLAGAPVEVRGPQLPLPGVAAKKRGRISKSAPGKPRSMEGFLTTQGGRFVYYLRSLGGKGTTRQIFDIIQHGEDKNKSSLSAALGTARVLGIVKAKSRSDGKGYTWEMTEEGVAEADKYGVICFTKSAFSVPPDAAKPAVALLRTWEDRHAKP